LEIGWVAISSISVATVFITGTGSGGGGVSGTISRRNRQSGSDSGGRVFKGGSGDFIGPTWGSTTGR